MRIGLTGGIGSGKSEVAKVFERLGALVIDTDLLAREAVAPGSDGLAEIARLWPQLVRGGALDRAAMAEVVFADSNARELLNGIVHPYVRRLAAQRERDAKPGQPVVQVVPLLFETELYRTMDRNVVVVAPDEQRIARAMRRDGSDEARVRARMAAQIDPQRARALADYTIENDGDLALLHERATAVYEKLAGY
ncbi:MAG TPA: dephospho-CoA kinase [Candidatus Baltobacteraceae bacterium]